MPTDPAAKQPGRHADTIVDLEAQHPPVDGVDKAQSPETANVPGLSDVFDALQKAVDKRGKTTEPVVIANIEIPDPKAALENMQEALRLLPSCLRPDLNDVFFKSLPGNKVGESLAEGAKIDPIMLLHPAHRIAHVIAHELAHHRNTVPNEGLVEMYLRAIGVVDEDKNGETKTTEKYDKALSGFSKFLGMMSKGGDQNAMAKEIYNLYYKGEYGRIYETYNQMYVETLPTGQRDDAAKFFWEVFPELEYDQKGQTKHQPLFKFKRPVIQAVPNDRNPNGFGGSMDAL